MTSIDPMALELGLDTFGDVTRDASGELVSGAQESQNLRVAGLPEVVVVLADRPEVRFAVRADVLVDHVHRRHEPVRGDRYREHDPIRAPGTHGAARGQRARARRHTVVDHERGAAGQIQSVRPVHVRPARELGALRGFHAFQVFR